MEVAPLAGAWIEIVSTTWVRSIAGNVAPLAGAWIEIRAYEGGGDRMGSLPLRERGLKLGRGAQAGNRGHRRSPCGSVD